MLPDGVSSPGPLTYESGALTIALRSPAPELWPFAIYNRRKTLSTQYLDNQLSYDSDN